MAVEKISASTVSEKIRFGVSYVNCESVLLVGGSIRFELKLNIT